MGPERYDQSEIYELNGLPELNGGSIEGEIGNPQLSEVELMRYELGDLTPEKDAVIDLTTLLVDRQGPELSSEETRRIRMMISIGLEEIFSDESLTTEERDAWRARVAPQAADEMAEYSGIQAAIGAAEKNEETHQISEDWAVVAQDYSEMTGNTPNIITSEAVEVIEFEEVYDEEPPEETVSAAGYTGLTQSVEVEPVVEDQHEAVEIAEPEIIEEAGQNESVDKVDMKEFEEDVKGDVPTWEEAEEEEVINNAESQFEDQNLTTPETNVASADEDTEEEDSLV